MIFHILQNIRKMQLRCILFIFSLGAFYLQAQNTDELARDLNLQAWDLRNEYVDSALILNGNALTNCLKTKDLELKSTILSVRGVLLKTKGDYFLSNQFHFAALTLREQINDTLRVSSSLNNLGNNFYLLDQPERAKEYHWKSLRMQKMLRDTTMIISAFNNLGNDYRALNDIDSALLMYKNGIILSVGDYEFEALDLVLNIGIIYNGQGEWSKSLENFSHSIKLHDKLNDDPFGKALSLHNLAIAYEGLKQYDSAQYYLYESKAIADSIENLVLTKDLYRSQMILDMKRNDEVKNLENFIIYSSLSDSISKQMIKADIAEVEAIYETKKKNTRIILETEKNKRMHAENERNTLTIFILLSFIAAIFILVTFTIRFYRQKRKLTRLELDQNKQEIARLMHGYELDLFEAQNFGQQEERQRIASDLHDRLGGLLAAVNLQVESLKYKAISEQQEELAKVKAMVSEGIKEVRNVAHNMRAEALTKHGLKGALEAISQSINTSKKVKIDLYLENLSDTTGSELEREVYKIIMELISNTLRHARADSITLQINEIDHELTVVFEDDGIGFLYSEDQHAGLGMENIKQRVKKLFGNLLVDSRPGSGTTIIIKIPKA